jgi:tRNA (cmo5U34)-methyltransferase
MLNQMPPSTTEFFNQISEDYDDVIAKIVPVYREILWAMLYYLPQDFEPRQILELGCGTGNLTRLLVERWPNSQITAVDISPEMLQVIEKKINSRQVSLKESSFEALQVNPNEFDLVISSLAIHHVQNPAKQDLLVRIHDWLTPGGFFVMGDQVIATSQRIAKADMAYYETLVTTQGATEEELQQWREHRDSLDHYATLANFTLWLGKAGFIQWDLLWRYLFWSVIQAQKSSV